MHVPWEPRRPPSGRRPRTARCPGVPDRRWSAHDLRPFPSRSPGLSCSPPSPRGRSWYACRFHVKRVRPRASLAAREAVLDYPARQDNRRAAMERPDWPDAALQAPHRAENRQAIAHPHRRPEQAAHRPPHRAARHPATDRGPHAARRSEPDHRTYRYPSGSLAPYPPGAIRGQSATRPASPAHPNPDPAGKAPATGRSRMLRQRYRSGGQAQAQPDTAQPDTDQPQTDQPNTDQPHMGRPYGGQPYGGQPYGGQPTGDLPARPAPASPGPVRSPSSRSCSSRRPAPGVARPTAGRVAAVLSPLS